MLLTYVSIVGFIALTTPKSLLLSSKIPNKLKNVGNINQKILQKIFFKMKVVPLTLKQANEFVDTYHKHNKKVVGCKFCIGVRVGDILEAVAIVGRPVARRLDDGLTVEILRLCTKQKGIKNLCSMLYSRSWRLWKLMGGKRILTYTLEEENGASLKASGYKITGETQPFKKGTGWTTREGRIWQKIQEQKRIRWEYQIEN